MYEEVRFLETVSSVIALAGSRQDTFDYFFRSWISNMRPYMFVLWEQTLFVNESERMRSRTREHLPEGNIKIIIKTKTYLRCTMTTCQKDQLFSRRMFVVVMIAGRKLDVYHLTLCLDERGKGLGGWRGRWSSVKAGATRTQRASLLVLLWDHMAVTVMMSLVWSWESDNVGFCYQRPETGFV